MNDPVEATPERLATSTFPMGVVTTDITKTEQRGSQRHITITADVLFDFDSVEGNPEFAAKGYGETKPVAENEKNGEDNPEGRAQNRRVEITYNLARSRTSARTRTSGAGRCVVSRASCRGRARHAASA